MIGKWYYGTGKKKTSISRVFLSVGSCNIFINGKRILCYFNNYYLLNILCFPFYVVNNFNFDVFCYVKGGGLSSKTYSLIYAISKALLEFCREYKLILRKNNLLSIDSRFVERKKIGYVKSRKRRQFSKR
ncbi:MAG: 30S ribosomal protein S9 [Candidatus Vidania fulgoroideorum]